MAYPGPSVASSPSPGPAHLHSRCLMAQGNEAASKPAPCWEKRRTAPRAPAEGHLLAVRRHVTSTGIVSLLRESPSQGPSLCAQGRARDKKRGRDEGEETLRNVPQQDPQAGGTQLEVPGLGMQVCCEQRRPGPEPLTAAPSENCETDFAHQGSSPGLSVKGWRQPSQHPPGMGT